jgi:hypothetical protein
VLRKPEGKCFVRNLEAGGRIILKLFREIGYKDVD